MWRILSVVILCVGYSSMVFGQASKSPFTAQGIGEINDLTLVNNDGMGGIGISSPQVWYMNLKNPALLPYNRLTVFSAGLSMENRTVENIDASAKRKGGNLEYLATAIPIMNGRWTSAIGIMPYSTVEYQYTETQTLTEDGLATLSKRGSGGFNQFFFANGVRLGKGFYIGAKATYLFSSFTEESDNIVVDTTLNTGLIAVALRNRIAVSDFIWQAGFAYTKDSIFNNDIRLTVGATYDFANPNTNVGVFQTLERQTLGVAQEADTLMDISSTIGLPGAYGFGITFAKSLKWQISAEANFQNWSEFKNVNDSNDGYADAMKLILGGEFTPDAQSVSNYFKRITLRGGVSYSQSAFSVNGNQVNELGINFGLSLPVSRFSSIDLAARYMNRGDIAETTIQEQAWRLGVGITFNDQWFIRRKYD